jgi:hypothetical protein
VTRAAYTESIIKALQEDGSVTYTAETHRLARSRVMNAARQAGLRVTVHRTGPSTVMGLVYGRVKR